MAMPNEKGPREPPGAAGTSRVAATVWLWVIVAGLVGLGWLQAQHPFFGMPLTHPLNLTLFALCLAVGVVFTAYIWLFEGRGRKAEAGALTAASLSEEVRRLADTGRKVEAIQVLRRQTGAGLAAAKAAVEEYLRREQ
jgi:hypothetical protein